MSLRTVFMGTPAIAVPSLRLLAERSHVQCVLSQPERPAGRGRRTRGSPVGDAARELGLELWTPANLRGAEHDPRLQGADLFVVLAYGALLRAPVLAMPAGDCINLHASLLPRWRGASPLQAAIRAGDRRTGISVMSMVPALDAGPVYLQESIELPADVGLPWLHDRLADLAATALGRFLEAWPEIEAVAQDEAAVSWCRKLTPEDGRLDFAAPMDELERQVRAYTPAPGCWARTAAGDRYRILDVAPVATVDDLAPGAVAVRDRRLLVGCGDGALAIRRLQAPGRRAMDVAAFLNGHAPPAAFAAV